MRKRSLEMVLSRLEDMEGPDPRLEQYRTPSDAVADVLYLGVECGDIEGRYVAELGCGGAPFLIGAILMGARGGYGCDKDGRAVELALRNIERSRRTFPEMSGWSDITVERADVSEVELGPGRVHTVLMNPPFGAQSKGADRPFMTTAMRLATVIHSIHNSVSFDFISRMLVEGGFRLTHRSNRTMTIPRRFHFHERERFRIPTVHIRAERAIV